MFHLHDVIEPWVGHEAIRAACAGLFTVSDGLVARKDSYIDWVTYQKQTGVDVSSVTESA